MNLYLVRHGQTEHNEAGTVAPVGSALTELGVTQAMSIGRRLKKLSFDKIFSSNVHRAMQTAQYITKHHTSPVVETGLLQEFRKPSEMLEMKHDGVDAQKIYKVLEAHMDEEEWHYSDEENYYDFRKRLLEFLSVVEREKCDNVLAVSHSLVVRLLTCLVIFGRDLNARDFHKSRWNLKVFNTGVTVLQYKNSSWKLVTFNDIAHLAE